VTILAKRRRKKERFPQAALRTGKGKESLGTRGDQVLRVFRGGEEGGKDTVSYFLKGLLWQKGAEPLAFGKKAKKHLGKTSIKIKEKH